MTDLAPLTALSTSEAARVLGCARSSVALARAQHPELAGPGRAPPKVKARGDPKPQATKHLRVRARADQLVALRELAARWGIGVSAAVWRAVAEAAAQKE